MKLDLIDDYLKDNKQSDNSDGDYQLNQNKFSLKR